MLKLRVDKFTHPFLKKEKLFANFIIGFSFLEQLF